MKVRQGFVSNSSSSSFVVVTTKAEWDKTVAKLSKLGQLVVEHELTKPTPVKFLGKNLIAIVQTISTEEFGCNLPDGSVPDGEYEKPYEEFQKFEELLRNNKDVLVLSGD